MFSLRRVGQAIVMLLTPFFCSAQDDFHWCTLNGGAGYSSITGVDAANLSGQWNAQAGVGFSVFHNQKAILFLNVDYLFDETSVKMSALTMAKNLNPTDIALLNATGGTSSFNVIAFNPTLRVPSAHAEFYVLGGFGWFRRQVELTGASNEGSLLQPGNPAVFLRDARSGAVDAGGGVNFKVKKGWAMPYIEVRVVHGLAVNHSTTVVPFAAGIRW